MNAEALEATVRRDLTPFADPDTEMAVTRMASAVAIDWSQSNRRRSATFRIGDDGIRVVEAGLEAPYERFFAGPTMADLDGLAQGAVRLHRSNAPFVAGRARLVEHDTDETLPALEALLRAVGRPEASPATRMVFLRAEAGVGKTTTLRRLCFRSAERRLNREASSVFLFIDAQGRGLRRLDEAIAVALDDLRSQLTYHVVPTLTRLGLLVPVIDGFDELIGASGTFDAAFDSLSAFVERLEGEGVFIASARSAYYEREFVSRVDREADRESTAWEETGVELLPWAHAEIDAYLRHLESRFHSAGLTGDDVRERFDLLFAGPNQTLRGKPLFVSRAVDLIVSGAESLHEPEGDLLSVLVHEYLRREVLTKLLSPETGEPLASDGQLGDFLAELAYLMWTLETRELEPDDVEDVAELFAELWELTPGSARMFREKSTSLAFLSRTSSQRVSFEHPLFFGFFLASRFPRLVADGDSAAGQLAAILGRSVLPEGAGPAVAQALLRGRHDEDELVDRVRRVCTLVTAAVRAGAANGPRTRENAGHLITGVLRYLVETGGVPTGLRLEALTFAGDDLADLEARGLYLADIEFRRANLRGTVLAGVNLGGVTIVDSWVDERTRIELSGEPVALISAVDGGRELHKPTDLERLSERIGLVARAPADAHVEWQVPGDVAERMERIARQYQRRNIVYVDDDYAGWLLTDELGERLATILIETGALRLETRDKSGPATGAFRLLVSSAEFLRSLTPVPDLDPRLAAAWRRFEAQAAEA